MTTNSSSVLSDDLRFEIPQGVGNTEDVEYYQPGGFHPVHIGDYYHDGRFKIVHKLGAGGFSTVWLARDLKRHSWAALKIVKVKESSLIEEKYDLVSSTVKEDARIFEIDGPNGRHLCLVLPVLGPCAADLSYNLDSRLRPSLARKVAYQTAKALSNLHSQGLTHGGQQFHNCPDKCQEYHN